MQLLAASKKSFITASNLRDEGMFPPDIEMTWLEDFRRPGKEHTKKYDIVFSYHDLPRSQIDDVVTVLRRWKHCLKFEGEVYTFVPSIEWAIRMIQDPESAPIWRRILWGIQKTEEELHLSGFTLLEWRSIFQRAGFGIVAAKTGSYEIEVEGKTYYMDHHFLMARKGITQRAKKIQQPPRKRNVHHHRKRA